MVGLLDYYAGRGDGSFHFGSIAGRANASPVQAVYGDFNGDGNLDVALAQGVYQSTKMAVMLSDGQGHFTLGSELTDYDEFYQILTGDFNRDGRLDLVVRGPFVLSTFLGNGDGTFTRYKDYKHLPFGLNLVAAGDFNGDGKLDLLGSGALPCEGICIDLLIGNGDGTFKPLQTVYSNTNMKICGFQNSYQVSDFNGDGKLDIAFCNQTGQVGVLLGNGDGTFQAPLFTPVANSIYSFAIGDINSDGKPDLVISQYGSVQSQFVVYFGNGDGTFQAPQSTDTIVTGELGTVVGDFNSDGLLDVIYQSSIGMDVQIQQQ